MKTIVVDGLPDDPLAAAGVFHQHWLALAEGVLAGGEDVALLLPAADHTHREWRLGIVAGLARKHAPQRVNLVAGEGEDAEATLAYLANAPGITGQYLQV